MYLSISADELNAVSGVDTELAESAKLSPNMKSAIVKHKYL